MPNARAWDKHQIKAEIARRGISLCKLGELYGLSRVVIGATLNNRSRPITAADQVISEFIGVPLHHLWPERYDDRGNRLVPLKPLRKVPALRSRPPGPHEGTKAA